MSAMKHKSIGLLLLTVFGLITFGPLTSVAMAGVPVVKSVTQAATHASTTTSQGVPGFSDSYDTGMGAAYPGASRYNTVKTMSEAKLFNLLNQQPKTIDNLVFENGQDTVLVYLVKDKKNSIYYQVTTGGSADQANLRQLAETKGVDFSNQVSGPSTLGSLLVSLLPILLIAGLVIYMLRRSQGGGGGTGGLLGNSKSATVKIDPAKRVTLADVAGQDEAKQEIGEVVDFLKDPGIFKEMGANVPRGIILTGPPGTGKTLFAKAVAGEAGVPFIRRSGSEFVEMYVGVGAKRVREMMEEAKKHGKCIVFIDEIDAFARKRSSGPGMGNGEAENTLNQLLTEMDGFDSSDGIVFIAATNRMDMLDPAILRPGRFDRKVSVGLPDKAARAQIFQLYLGKKKCTQEVLDKIEHWAKITPGASGAVIAGAVNEAAVLASRRIKQARKDGKTTVELITASDLDEGILRATWGAASESKARLMTVELKRNLAIHEAGHAIVAMAHGDDPGRITIMPRGQTGGHYQSLSDTDGMQTYAQLIAMIDMALAGRAAQKVLLGRADTGCSNDLMQANNIAGFLTTQVGMSRLGAIYLPEGEKPSEEIKAVIKELVDERQGVVENLIGEHKTRLEAVVEALLERETLLGFELKAIWEGFGEYRSAKVDLLPVHEKHHTTPDSTHCDCVEPVKPATKPQSAIGAIGDVCKRLGRNFIPGLGEEPPAEIKGPMDKFSL